MGLKEFFTYMNKYFAILFDIIVSNQGFLDKIVGDEFMAIWGTPVNPRDHATHACYTAIDMQAKLRALREGGEVSPRMSFRISIGINSGDALIGNFGPPKFLQYTPLGDTINFGARLEGLARKYGVEIAIGEATYENAGSTIIARKLDDVEVKYQSEKIGVYELVARKSAGVSDKVRRKLEAFEAGYSAFDLEEYDEARKNFLAALGESDGTDMPSLIYLQRCAEKSSTR
jgi:adenylate cyclase